MARKPRDRREATFFEHLEELRMRLIRCIIYVAVCAAISWFARETLMELAQWPIYRAGVLAGIEGIEFKEFKPAGALVLTFHIAFVAGIILAAPAWLMEAWLFVEPALEDHERKWVVPLLPAAVGLFLGGVGFCYWLSPRALAVLLGFQEDLGVAPEFILRDYLGFFLRLLLIFGVMFEMPLVIMFLSAVGMVRSQWLLERWRIAVVLIAVVCAIVTPTPDAVTLSFLAGPMIGLYMLSILLARLVEKGKEKARAAEEAEAAASAGDEDPYAEYALPEAPDPEEGEAGPEPEPPAEEQDAANGETETEPDDEEDRAEERQD
jgi:sec-independent protein translocase protein TatC